MFWKAAKLTLRFKARARHTRSVSSTLRVVPNGAGKQRTSPRRAGGVGTCATAPNAAALLSPISFPSLVLTVIPFCQHGGRIVGVATCVVRQTSCRGSSRGGGIFGSTWQGRNLELRLAHQGNVDAVSHRNRNERDETADYTCSDPGRLG